MTEKAELRERERERERKADRCTDPRKRSKTMQSYKERKRIGTGTDLNSQRACLTSQQRPSISVQSSSPLSPWTARSRPQQPTHLRHLPPTWAVQPLHHLIQPSSSRRSSSFSSSNGARRSTMRTRGMERPPSAVEAEQAQHVGPLPRGRRKGGWWRRRCWVPGAREDGCDESRFLGGDGRGGTRCDYRG